ncbi:hypothetical protein [uncultured Kordia sp.]|uniref:hypothetical protein n=1 Tax=uncultured Kordia sp. TaxID=507699 RepID=UPI00261DCC18|nr:hypothetical protein [uncultured Kordia sp.]
MRLKITLLLFLFIYTFSAKAQTNIYPEKLFDYGDYYYWKAKNIKGNIKKVTVRNYTYAFHKPDSSYVEYATSNDEKDVFVDMNQVFEFDAKKNLIKTYELKNDNVLFLEKENVYNRKGKLAHQTIHNEVKKKFNGKDSTYVHQIRELRTYNLYGKLEEVWQKSSYQNAYFLKERYFYTDANVLSKYESLNANIRTEHYVICKGSLVDTDYIKLYKYDAKNRLIEEKIHAYEYDLDETNVKAIDHRDFSAYTLSQIITYKYNDQDLIIKETREHFGSYLEKTSNTITRMYDQKNRLISEMTTYHNLDHGNGYEYEYYEKEGELYKIKTIHVDREKDNKLIKKLQRTVEKQADGFKECYFKNDTIVNTAFYTPYGDQRKHQDFEYNEETSYQYIYDKHGNWTSRILFQNGIKKEKTTRTLAYFSE